jgi:hypothetical protein
MVRSEEQVSKEFISHTYENSMKGDDSYSVFTLKYSGEGKELKIQQHGLRRGKFH